jgi:hypothetical protein
LIKELKWNVSVPCFEKRNDLKVLIWQTLLGITYSLLAYRGNGLTIGGDNIIPLHSLEYLARIPSLSDPWAGLGSHLPPIFSLPTIPDTFLFFLFSPFDIYIANKLYMFVLSTLSVFSIYYLATTIFRANAHKSVIGIMAACAYLFNPWVLADTYKTMIFIELSLVQSGFILFLAFTVKYFQTQQTRYVLCSGLSTFLMLSCPGLSAYRLAFFAFFGYVFIAVYYLANIPRTEFSRVLHDISKGAIIVAAISFVLNSYWIIPFLQNASYFSSYAMGFQTTTIFNEYSTMINTLRLMNSWSFYSGYVPYAEVFLKNPIVIALTFAWPIFAFAPLFSKRAIKNRKILTIYAATILTILLSWGSEYPLGQAYMKIVDVHVGPYYFLRPFYNTGVFSLLLLTLEYALLIGLFSSLVYSWLMKRNENSHHSRKKIVTTGGTILIVIILASSSWPILTGDVMRNWYSPDQYGVRIPERYWETNEYIERISSLNHKTLLLPSTEIYVGTSWGYQGTSQFYNLMFNVPLITGNEIPYGITANKTLVNQVYSIYYRVPDLNDTLDVINRTSKIVTWQNDKAVMTHGSLQIDFNSTYEIGRWHQIELRLPSAEVWSNSTHIMFQLTAELSLDRLQIGIGDAKGYGGWWSAQKHMYHFNNGTLIPTETEPLITQNNETITLLMALQEPDLSTYSIGNVTSVWIQYFVANSSDTATLRINKIQAGRVSLDDLYYANFLAENKIKYLLVDLSIQDGAKTNPKLWLDLLNNSDYFKLIWQKDTLYVFENAIF